MKVIASNPAVVTSKVSLSAAFPTLVVVCVIKYCNSQVCNQYVCTVNACKCISMIKIQDITRLKKNNTNNLGQIVAYPYGISGTSKFAVLEGTTNAYHFGF